MSALPLLPSASGPFLEASPGSPLMRTEADATRIVEACFSAGAHRVLLYSANLTPGFFDLSSREAGDVLQMFRNYGIQVAILCAGDLQASRLFGEFASGENRGAHVRFFNETDRDEAVRWLCGS